MAWAVGSVVLFGALFLLTIWLTDGTVSDRENGLYQFISLGVGVFASFALGRQSTRSSAREMLEPHASAAVRRLVTLAAGMQAMGAAMNAQRAFAEETAEAGDGGPTP